MKIVDMHIQSARGTDSRLSGIKVRVADGYFSRLRGLLGSKRLEDTEGLLLKGCSSVHTIGMHYPLDLVFMDQYGKVLKCREGLKPFRAASAKGAYYTLELNQGVVRKQGIEVNDQFEWQGVKKASHVTQ